MQVISGIDIALWDIIGKRVGQPIYKLLGAGYRDKVRAYASTLFRSTPEGMAAASAHYLDLGFTAVKFGWGVFGEDAERDVELVAAARQALWEIGPRLLIDTGWYIHRTAKEAIQMVRRLEQYRPFLIEEPLSPEDYDGYAQLSGAVDTLIACGEQEATEWGFRTLIERGRVDVIQPDLSRCGGFTAARKIVHMAELHNRLLYPACLDLRFTDCGLASSQRFHAPSSLSGIQCHQWTAEPRTVPQSDHAEGWNAAMFLRARDWASRWMKPPLKNTGWVEAWTESKTKLPS